MDLPNWIDVGQPDRLLPAGVHDATIEEVKVALVDAFPSSTTRAPIFSLWLAWRSRLQAYVDVKDEFIDGSFVTDRLDPHDLDTSIWFEADDLLGLSPLQLLDLQTHFEFAKQNFKTHAFPVPICDPGHPAYPGFDHLRSETPRWWQAYKDPAQNVVAGVSKGYVRIVE